MSGLSQIFSFLPHYYPVKLGREFGGKSEINYLNGYYNLGSTKHVVWFSQLYVSRPHLYIWISGSDHADIINLLKQILLKQVDYR